MRIFRTQGMLIYGVTRSLCLVFGRFWLDLSNGNHSETSLTLLSLNFRQTFFPFFVCTDRPCQGPRQVFVGDGTACPRATGRIRDGAIAPGGCDRMLPKERNQPLHRLQGSKPKILWSCHAKGHGTTSSKMEERSQTRWLVKKGNDYNNQKTTFYTSNCNMLSKQNRQ